MKDTGESQPQQYVLNVKEVIFIKKLEAISAIEGIANSKRRLEENSTRSSHEQVERDDKNWMAGGEKKRGS
jgi:hypothetical protein